MNATLFYTQLLKLFKARKKQQAKKKKSPRSPDIFFWVYMTVTMNILVHTKSFVFFGKHGVWMSKKDAQSHEGRVHLYFQYVGSTDVWCT